jgi:homogentisate 1,2-dioxygenase
MAEVAKILSPQKTVVLPDLKAGCSLEDSCPPEAFAKASTAELKPHKLTNTMAFMFETRLPQRVSAFAAALPQLQAGYMDCWSGLQKTFDPTKA